VPAAALTAFSAAGLMTRYLRVPGMRQPRDLRPTPEGVALSKDVWLLGIGVSLLVDALADAVGRDDAAAHEAGAGR
jgi:hypothetical protein